MTLLDIGRMVTDVGLVIAFILFAYMSLKSSNPDLPRWKSLKPGLALVTFIWLIPEAAANWLPTYLPYLGYGREGVGSYVHFVSMVVFTAYIFLRARVFLRK